MRSHDIICNKCQKKNELFLNSDEKKVCPDCGSEDVSRDWEKGVADYEFKGLADGSLSPPKKPGKKGAWKVEIG